MEQKQKLEIGERIKWLRENSAETNRSIASYADVSVEAVRNWIAGKGIKYDNAEKVAAMFKLDVDWVWRGEGGAPDGYPQEEQEPAPDLLGQFAGESKLQDQLDRIEKRQEDMDRKLDEILRRLPAVPPQEPPAVKPPPSEPTPPIDRPDEEDGREEATG